MYNNAQCKNHQRLLAVSADIILSSWMKPFRTGVLPFRGWTVRSSSAARRWAAPPPWPRRTTGAHGCETNDKKSTSPPSAETQDEEGHLYNQVFATVNRKSSGEGKTSRAGRQVTLSGVYPSTKACFDLEGYSPDSLPINWWVGNNFKQKSGNTHI